MDDKPADAPMGWPAIRFKKLHPEAVIPRYMTPGSAGMDLVSIEEGEIAAGMRAMVNTGLAMEIPEGYEGQVRTRSGLALKKGVVVANSPGTIDSDYRGQIGVILQNNDPAIPFALEKGMRIAQLVICPVLQADVEEVSELSETSRGSGGFGHTGT